MDLRQLQSLLLDLISTRKAVAVGVIEALTDEHWQSLMKLVRQNRLAPLLHWRLTHERSHLTVPNPVSVELARGFKASLIRNLNMQREMLSTCRMLEISSIPYVFLKGAYLAFFSYEHPALRPLRDIDILVTPGKGLEAFQLLINCGLARRAEAPGNPEAALEAGVHYPPLASPHGGTTIELHARLFHCHSAENSCSDPADDPAYWSRIITRKLAGNVLHFASPTDLLFHLIVHAAYDHNLNNGPLTLSDIASLLHAEPVDWPLFWSLASASHRLRGCLLLLQMTDHYYGPLPINYQDLVPLKDQHLVTEWSTLLLQDPATRHTARVLDNTVSFEKRLSVILREIFPSKLKIAARYPVHQDSIRVYGYYFHRWWWLLNTRLKETLVTRKGQGMAQESRSFAKFQQWLLSSE
jgi:hypothetical protein